jgi:hypothetical protein
VRRGVGAYVGAAKSPPPAERVIRVSREIIR